MTEPSLADLHKLTDAGFGGKAEGLAKLVRANLPVPEGFAVSATMVSPSDWSEGAKDIFAERCRALLSEGPLAIRSSAIGEDGVDRSFAGLFQSVLGVESESEALSAAATCIASGAAERVLRYSSRTSPLPVGLVVQRMVDARWAGVAFSRDPAGRDPAVVVEAVEGAGEELVSGRRTPETWRIYETGFGEIETRRMGSTVALPEARVHEIAAIARKLVAEWDEHLDLEWAIDAGGRLWWLQARPITTGEPWRPPVVQRSAHDVDDGPVSLWTNMNVRENMPDPVHPLTWSVWRDTLVPVVTQGLTRIPENSPELARAGLIELVNGRIYISLNAMIGSPPLGKLGVHLPNPLDEGIGQAVRDLVKRGVLQPRRNPGVWSAWRRGLVSGLFPGRRHAESARRPGGPQEWLDAMSACADDIRDRVTVKSLSDEELLVELLVLAKPELAILRAGMRVAGRAVAAWMAANKVFAPWPDTARRLATGVTGNPTTEISLGIDALAWSARPFAERWTDDRSAVEILSDLRVAAADDGQIEAWLAALEEFLHAYGHRAPREFDLATPRWAEDPTMIVELVRAGLAHESDEPLSTRLARMADERERSVADAIREAGFARRPLMRWAARAVPAWMPMREAPKHHIMLAFHRSRQAALEIGRRLVERGRLTVDDEIFLLYIEEVRDVLLHDQPVPNVLHQRRRDLQRWGEMPAPDIVRSDGVPVDTGRVDGGSDGDELRGHGIGGGSGVGPVRILEAPDPTAMQDGDVLVITFADPGWTPLFPRAGAIVMEVGGTMCHAAVVARELGIPAVFSVADAKTRLEEGEIVRVDGDTGLVLPMAEPSR